jgi:hypothetical protein
MLKSKIFRTMICALFLPAGSCLRPDPVASTEPLFCDIEEPRRFSQAELDWRAKHASWNLRRDFKTNMAWDRECADIEVLEMKTSGTERQ